MQNDRSDSTSPFPVRRIYICGNGKCTNHSAAEGIYNYLQSLIHTHQLDEFEAPYRVKCQLAGCLDICENGVTIVVLPERIYYWNIDQDKAEKIFIQHLLNNRPVEEFMYKPNH